MAEDRPSSKKSVQAGRTEFLDDLNVREKLFLSNAKVVGERIEALANNFSVQVLTIKSLKKDPESENVRKSFTRRISVLKEIIAPAVASPLIGMSPEGREQIMGAVDEVVMRVMEKPVMPGIDTARSDVEIVMQERMPTYAPTTTDFGCRL